MEPPGRGDPLRRASRQVALWSLYICSAAAAEARLWFPAPEERAERGAGHGGVHGFGGDGGQPESAFRALCHAAGSAHFTYPGAGSPPATKSPDSARLHTTAGLARFLQAAREVVQVRQAGFDG